MKKQITVISGHYGSGKSEIAVNLAIQKKADIIIDLDIVNPYFRTREAEEVLKTHNIEVVSSPLEKGKHADLPYLSARMYAPFYNESLKAIYDLGGDGVGAKVFRQFEDFDTTAIDHFVVINIFRELTSSKPKIVAMINQIEANSGIKVTGLINNTNLLRETTFEDVLKGQEIIREVSRELKLKIVYTTLLDQIKIDVNLLEGEVIPLILYLRKTWL